MHKYKHKIMFSQYTYLFFNKKLRKIVNFVKILSRAPLKRVNKNE